MKLSTALTEYEAHVRAMGLEPRTVKNRTQPVKRALQVWGNLDLRDIQPIHINHLFEGQDYAPRTRNLYLGHLRKFFDWARYNEYMGKKDPTYGWSPAKVIAADRLRIPVARFPELLDAAGEQHARDRAALAVAMFTFMRGSEIQNLKISDLDLGEGRLHIYRVKTKEFDSLPVCAELAEEMITWLNYYRAEHGTLMPHWYLLPSKGPNAWGMVDGTWQSMNETARLRPTEQMTHPYRLAQRAIKAIGYEDTLNEGMHTLRRSGSRALLDTLRSEGTESALLRVGAMLGHKDTKVTAHYVGLQMEREQRDVLIAGKKMFPTTREPGLKVVSNG